MKMKSSGRTSGLAIGKVKALNVELTILIGSGQRVKFKDLIVIDPISQPGDSGAPVLTADNKLVGMIYAGGSAGAIAIPIQQILNEFKVKLSD